jgi:hypothetical protein
MPLSRAESFLVAKTSPRPSSLEVAPRAGTDEQWFALFGDGADGYRFDGVAGSIRRGPATPSVTPE